MKDTLEKVNEVLSDYFITGEQFNEYIQEIINDESNSLYGIFYSVVKKIGKNTFKYELGMKGEGENTSLDTFCDDDVEVKVLIWDESREQAKHKQIVSEIIKKYLNIEELDKNSLLPNRQNVLSKCNKTLTHWLRGNKSVAIFMLDIDHFKQVNDKYDHEVGSMVIKEFANILYDKGYMKAVLIHQSGDEFNIMMQYESPNEVMELAFLIRESAKTYKYQHGDNNIHLTAAQGVCLIEQEGADFEQAVLKAERAYFPKGKNKSKFRDSIRIIKYNECEPMKKRDSQGKLAYVLIRTNAMDKRLLKNIYLDYIRYYISEMNIDEADKIHNLLEWISPIYIDGMMRCINCINNEEEGWDCTEQLSPEEVLFAVFSGLYINKALSGKKVVLKDNGAGNGIVTLDEKVIFLLQKGMTFTQEKRFEAVVPEYDILNGEWTSFKRTVLIYIGYDAIVFPEKIFYRILRVDDRPITGGGLPDFWASTLSELIGCVQDNPYITQVLICGKHEYAPKLCSILLDIEKWESGDNKLSYEFLAKKTNRRLSEIKYCQNKLAGNVKKVEWSEMVDILFRSVRVNTDVVEKKVKIERHTDERFLNRRLSYDPIRLKITDGCYVDSMAEAFPTVLEILRNCLDEDRRQIIIDQAGRKLIELENFKLVLNKPDSMDIPGYYRDESDELDKYYYDVLGSDNALFKQCLCEDNQLEAVIQHVVGLLTENGIRYATRRAILVIGHEIKDAGNISPLGLVNIWIAPRQDGKNVIFDYTFSWRTVEAMIGLPFSLYATVRYAEDLTKEISNRVGVKCREIIRLGKVSYIANSLHMFLDHACLEIVRGVVNEATK